MSRISFGGQQATTGGSVEHLQSPLDLESALFIAFQGRYVSASRTKTLVQTSAAWILYRSVAETEVSEGQKVWVIAWSSQAGVLGVFFLDSPAFLGQKKRQNRSVSRDVRAKRVDSEPSEVFAGSSSATLEIGDLRSACRLAGVPLRLKGYRSPSKIHEKGHETAGFIRNRVEIFLKSISKSIELPLNSISKASKEL